MQYSQSLLDRPEFLTALFSSTNEGIVACNAKGELIFANQKAQEFFGGHQGAEDLKSWQDYYDVYYPDRLTPVEKENIPLWRAFKGETFRNVEIFVNRKNQDPLLFICNGQPIVDHAGTKIGAIVTFQDITNNRLNDALAELNTALKRSETRFRAIFEQSPLSIQLLSKDGRTLLVNPAYCQLWGLSEEFVQNFILKEYNMLEDKIIEDAGQMENIRNAFRGETVLIPEFFYDPSIIGLTQARSRWAKGILYPLKNSANEVMEVVVIHQDVTSHQEIEQEREKLLAQIKFEQSRMAAIIGQMPAGLMVSDAPSGQISLYNDQMIKMLGNISTARDRLKEPLDRSLSGEIIDGEEIEIQNQDGSHTIISASSGPIHDSKGNIAASVVISTDITEKKKNESIQNFMTHVKSMLISSIDHKEIIDQVASAAIPFLADGCMVDFLEGDTIKRLVTKHTNPELQEVMKTLAAKYPPSLTSPSSKVLKSGEPELLETIVIEDVLIHSPSQEHADFVRKLNPKSYISVPLKIRGKTIGTMNFLITSDHRQKYDETDLETAMELGRHAVVAIDNARLFRDVQTALSLRDDFISIASHELRTPITSLLLQIEVLNDLVQNLGVKNSQTDLMEKFIQGTNGQLSRLTRLVEDMLDISRISSGKLTMNPRKIIVSTFLKEILDKFSDQLKSLGITFEYFCESEVSALIDPERFEQVITNFMTNAIRYGDRKPVHVYLSQDQQSFKLQFQDFGRGIATEDQERVFKRFERAHTSQDVNGLGLGLFINKQIVEEHGGHIRLFSELAKGSTFIVEFPKEI